MDFWNKFIFLVWRLTIGPALFCLLLLCGIASIPLGGRRFFTGCLIMARFAGCYYAGGAMPYCGLHEIRGMRYPEPERTNPLSALLWNVLFGVWLQILFLLLAVGCHLLPISHGYAYRMLDIAHGVRNPAYVIER